MNKILALALCTLALAACSDMNGPHWMGNSGNRAETKNSSDANKSGNPAAVSPGGGTGSGAGASGSSSSGAGSR